jgi:hypothetical protein
MVDVRTGKDAQVMLQNKSEVVRIKEQMVAEYEAGKRGLVGLAHHNISLFSEKWKLCNGAITV